MEALKRQIELKRKSVAENFSGRKFVKRSELDQKELDRIREEEKKDLLQRTAKSRVSSAAPGCDSPDDPLSLSSQAASKAKNPSSEEQKLDDLILPRAEVVRRLRILKHPITLFGEDDDMRLARLKALLRAGVADPDNELMEGQRNDFLRDLTDLKNRQKTGHVERRKHKSKHKGGVDDDDDGMGNVELGDQSGDGGSSGLDNDKDTKRMKTNFDELCDEDKILVFFKRLLHEWEQELEDRPDIEQRTGRGKSSVATFKQCARYLNPLFKMCRKRVLPDDIRQALLIVVNCCMERDYLTAMDQYIKLAIGNAPWPIGVTMVGIHERSAREKIYTNSVAHIMNDETTRKYLQSVKRLMTLCQRRYPSVPSKSVEFNSLANGSDLQSLLADEKAKNGNQFAEDRLRLMGVEYGSP